MVEEGYPNQEIQRISGASKSTVSCWKKQYQNELAGITPEGSAALTPEHQCIQVWFALLTTATGIGGLITAFTYIVPTITDVAGFAPGDVP